MTIQFPLEFEFQTKDFDSFYPATNSEVIPQLRKFIESDKSGQVFLCGDHGYGKSHLLQASCQYAHKIGISAFYYPFNRRKLPSLELFDGLEHIELVCFDDIDQTVGLLNWEQGLINFFTQQARYHSRLILSAQVPPQQLTIQLPQLKQILNNNLILTLKVLSNDESVSALIYKAHYMGLTITPKVGHFLFNHYAHDLPSLWILLDQLDKATLAAQRKLTIPFLKQILEN
jgi:DnaA family protein